MKKKLLEKDAFYLSLFICICIIAIGGIWFTNKNVDNLLSKNTPAKTEDEIHLTENKKKDVVPTTTDSEQNLAKAKEEEHNKISYLGNQVIRSYSEKEPSYSETLEVWEIHKAIDVEANENQEIKSLTKGTVLDVYDDDQYGMSVKIKSEDNTVFVYSSLSENIKIRKNDKITEGQCIGYASNTSNVECLSGAHVHLEAYKNNILTKIILLEDTICNYDIEKIYVTKEVMKKLTELDTPNKIIGIVKKNTPLPIGNKILILDNIQDPGNLGTIIRSSVAFDIDTIVLSPNTVDIYNPKVIRSTQGMIFYTNIITLELKEFINEIKTKNYTIFGTNVRNGKNIKEITLPEKFALVLGNEGQGVSKEIESLCDDNIYIKMSSKCESLNVSVATSILLYEVYNK